jgi:hypothetical protein
MYSDQYALHFNIPPPKYVTAALFFLDLQYTDKSAAVPVLAVNVSLHGKY